MDASGECVLSMATASPGVLVSAPAISYHAWRVDVERIFQPCRRQSGGTNNQQGDDNECLPFAPEGIEEARTGLYADGEYE